MDRIFWGFWQLSQVLVRLFFTHNAGIGFFPNFYAPIIEIWEMSP